MKLTYVIKYVSEMEPAVRFYRDQLGLPLIFQSPGWSEFDTGETTLALHTSSEANPAGTTHIGFGVHALDSFYEEMKEKGIKFTSPPTDLFGSRIARFEHSE